VLGVARPSPPRDYISIVGSSTVYPFATVVAEQFGKTTSFKTPKSNPPVRRRLKLFCAGVGVEHPDITNASRRIKKSEFEKCQPTASPTSSRSRSATTASWWPTPKKAPLEADPQGHLPGPGQGRAGSQRRRETGPNPYKTWKDVNPALPDVKIEVLGPPPTSGTRDAFVELAMEAGAEASAGSRP
jgi:phosphate transport system substrate-binding protein